MSDEYDEPLRSRKSARLSQGPAIKKPVRKSNSSTVKKRSSKSADSPMTSQARSFGITMSLLGLAGFVLPLFGLQLGRLQRLGAGAPIVAGLLLVIGLISLAVSYSDQTAKRATSGVKIFLYGVIALMVGFPLLIVLAEAVNIMRGPIAPGAGQNRQLSDFALMDQLQTLPDGAYKISVLTYINSPDPRIWRPAVLSLFKRNTAGPDAEISQALVSKLTALNGANDAVDRRCIIQQLELRGMPECLTALQERAANSTDVTEQADARKAIDTINQRGQAPAVAATPNVAPSTNSFAAGPLPQGPSAGPMPADANPATPMPQQQSPGAQIVANLENQMKSRDAVAVLTDLAKDPSAQPRVEVTGFLAKYAANPNKPIQIAAINALAVWGTPLAMPLINVLIKSRDSEIKLAAEAASAKIRSQPGFVDRFAPKAPVGGGAP